MVRNVQLEDHFRTEDYSVDFAPEFVSLRKILSKKYVTQPLNGLCFLMRDDAISEVSQGFTTFSDFSMQLQPESN